MKLSVIVPVYNEEKTIESILQLVRKQTISGIEIEIIVINDGSKDGTKGVLEGIPHLYDKFVHLERNGGKGAAVIAGLQEATGDYVLFQDGDLEYNPDDYATLLRPVIEMNADVVIGSRFLAPAYVRVFRFSHLVGNKIITLFFNILNNTTFTDIYSCYLMYRRKLISPKELLTSGWQQHAEILSLAVHRSIKHYEVPISYNGRTFQEGKKIRYYHVFKVLQTIFRMRRSRGKTRASFTSRAKVAL